MELIESGTDRVEVADRSEIFVDRHRQGVLLPAVAHVQESPENDLLPRRPFFGQNLGRRFFQRYEGVRDFRARGLAQLAHESLHVIVLQIREQHSECGEMRRHGRDDHLRDGKFSRNGDRVQRAASPARNKNAVARIVALSTDTARTASDILKLAIVKIPSAASSSESPRGLPIFSVIACAAFSRCKRMPLPRKYSGSILPTIKFASVTVGSVPP